MRRLSSGLKKTIEEFPIIHMYGILISWYNSKPPNIINYVLNANY